MLIIVRHAYFSEPQGVLNKYILESNNFADYIRKFDDMWAEYNYIGCAGLFTVTFCKKTFTHLKVSCSILFLGRSEEEADGDDGEGEKTKRTGELSDDVKS